MIVPEYYSSNIQYTALRDPEINIAHNNLVSKFKSKLGNKPSPGPSGGGGWLRVAGARCSHCIEHDQCGRASLPPLIFTI